MPNANPVACRAKIKGSCSGCDNCGAYNGSTIWRMTNGEWWRFHTTIRTESNPSA